MIRILPESSGNLVAAQASDRLTAGDYKEVWSPRLRQTIDAHGSIRVLLYLDETFRGWEARALWEDAKLGLEKAEEFEKIALVGASELLETLVERVSHLMKTSVKTFPTGGLQDALDWIR